MPLSLRNIFSVLARFPWIHVLRHLAGRVGPYSIPSRSSRFQRRAESRADDRNLDEVQSFHPPLTPSQLSFPFVTPVFH
ncbi:hypothetical protein ABKN59_009578 [Abortiporus biennis]